MPNTEEQRLDLIENCDVLLNGILAPFEQTDHTPEGRMITQLKWLKERADNHDLPLPVDPDNLATIRYIYTDGELCRHASNPKDKRSVDDEVEIPMSNILSIAKHGRLIYKSEYKSYVLRCINSLLELFFSVEQKLTKYELGFIEELSQIKNSFIEDKIIPPLGGQKEYPNLIEVKWSNFHIPNSEILFKIFNNAIFNGTRPDSWLSPRLADKETQQYLK